MLTMSIRGWVLTLYAFLQVYGRDTPYVSHVSQPQISAVFHVSRAFPPFFSERRARLSPICAALARYTKRRPCNVYILPPTGLTSTGTR